MNHAVIKIGGMSCQGCVDSVTRVLKAIEGVDRLDVSLEAGEAAVDYDARKVDLAALRRAINDAGYEAR